MDRLQSILKQGALISGADLKPLASDFFDLWNNVNGNWNFYKTSVTQILPYQQVKATTSSSALKSTTKTINQLLLKKQF